MNTLKLAIVVVLSGQFASCVLEKINQMMQVVNVAVDVVRMPFLVANKSNNFCIDEIFSETWKLESFPELWCCS